MGMCVSVFVRVHEIGLKTFWMSVHVSELPDEIVVFLGIFTIMLCYVAGEVFEICLTGFLPS